MCVLERRIHRRALKESKIIVTYTQCFNLIASINNAVVTHGQEICHECFFVILSLIRSYKSGPKTFLAILKGKRL